MGDRDRVLETSDRPPQGGRFVLYWMQASQRAVSNPALQHAVDRARELDLPLVAAFGLTAAFPEANARHYAFMLEGLAETSRELAERGIRLLLRAREPADLVAELGQEAALTVTDVGYLRIQRRWREAAAARCGSPLVAVEGEVVVPARTVSTKEEWSARTIRPRIRRHLDRFLAPVKDRWPKRDSLGLTLPGDGLDPSDASGCLAAVGVDPGGAPGAVSAFRGGPGEAQRRLRQFVESRLARYHDELWNAAMREMLVTGKMHNTMRMYWGKKILEWSADPREAFDTALALNNRYSLDGRDPNSFAGVPWCFGKHDQAWGERPIFGKVRYMSAAGLGRKLDMAGYLSRVEGLQSDRRP